MRATARVARGLKIELQRERLGLAIPVRLEFAWVLVDLLIRDLEGDRLVGLSGEEQVLPLAVWRFHALLVRGHEAVARLQALLDLRVVDLEQQRALRRLRVKLFRDAVAGTTDLDRLPRLCLLYTSDAADE